jgi:hypothetical protein
MATPARRLVPTTLSSKSRNSGPGRQKPSRRAIGLAVITLILTAAAAWRVATRRWHIQAPIELRAEKGKLYTRAGTAVGILDDMGRAWLAIGRRGEVAIALDDAICGHFRAGNDARLLRFVSAHAVPGGYLPGGEKMIALDDGAPILVDGEPRPSADLGARIDLDDGRSWLTVSFAAPLEPERLHWVRPGHDANEIAVRGRDLAAEVARLPPAERARLTALLPVVTLVSTVEGSFGDVAGPNDTSASIGICQWAAARRQPVAPDTSLARFFTSLEARSKTPKHELGRLAGSAWSECRAAGLELSGGRLRIDRHLAVADDIESRLRGPMAQGALRTWQLVAARDLIAEIQSVVVRPGRYSRDLLHVDYSESDGGRTITLGSHGRSLTLEAPDGAATVAQIARTPRLLGNIANLGVNRPRFVEAAVWRALGPDDAAAQIDALVPKCLNARGRLRARCEEKLTELLWPSARPEEEVFLHGFRRAALALYPAGDRARRARRMVTGEAGAPL